MAVLLAGLATGCHGAPERQSYPDDPLLVSRKPVEGKREKAEPVLIARSEPAEPRPPSDALASAPVDLWSADKTRLAKKSAEPARPSQPAVTATPAARTRTTPSVPAVPASRSR